MNNKLKWINISGYEMLYKINEFGEIKDILKNNIIKQTEGMDGYYFVILVSTHNSMKYFKAFRVHELMHKCFKLNHNKRFYYDGDNSNNKISNLCTFNELPESSKIFILKKI